MGDKSKLNSYCGSSNVREVTALSRRICSRPCSQIHLSIVLVQALYQLTRVGSVALHPTWPRAQKANNTLSRDMVFPWTSFVTSRYRHLSLDRYPTLCLPCFIMYAQRAWLFCSLSWVYLGRRQWRSQTNFGRSLMDIEFQATSMPSRVSYATYTFL